MEKNSATLTIDFSDENIKKIIEDSKDVSDDIKRLFPQSGKAEITINLDETNSFIKDTFVKCYDD